MVDLSATIYGKQKRESKIKISHSTCRMCSRSVLLTVVQKFTR